MNVSMIEYLTTLNQQKNHSFTRIYNSCPISEKVSLSTMLCMWMIYKNEGGCSATDLRTMSCYDKSLISRMLSDLQENGYIIRNPEDDGKKRGMRYILSDQGVNVVEDMQESFLKFTDKISEDIPKEDLRTFLDVSVKLIGNIENYAKQLESKNL